jgi:hypothetical protein
MIETWEDSQKVEAGFWGTCANTYGEETKQLVYMKRMGFSATHDGRSPFSYDGKGLSYLDIGGGPVSVLLKFRNARQRIVVEPCSYPFWVYGRYRAEGIEFFQVTGEDLDVTRFPVDVALIYNVLQHVRDPKKVVRNAMEVSQTLHMFEWIDLPPHPGHPHCLTKEALEHWSGQKGTVEQFTGHNECYGKAWFI